MVTSLEPFSEYSIEKLRSDAGGEQYDQPQTYNANQNKYVFHSLYRNTKTEAEQQQSEKNKFQLRDRKSTRLNSSHVAISYAVFCLKKKKQKKTQTNEYK